MIIGRKMLVKDEVTSTNDIAKAMAMEGEQEGTVIVASSQTAGRGRKGRSWESPPGGIYISIILRPELAPADLTLLTILSCVPVAETIAEMTGLQASIKWPNDVLVDGRKVAGLLMEAGSASGTIKFLVLGIGINLNVAASDLKVSGSGSLLGMTGRRFDSERFIHTLLYRMDDMYSRFKLGERELKGYEALCETIGKDIEFRIGDQTVRGKAMYLDLDGAMVIRNEDGMVHRLSSVHDTVPLGKGQTRLEINNVN